MLVSHIASACEPVSLAGSGFAPSRVTSAEHVARTAFGPSKPPARTFLSPLIPQVRAGLPFVLSRPDSRARVFADMELRTLMITASWR